MCCLYVSMRLHRVVVMFQTTKWRNTLCDFCYVCMTFILVCQNLGPANRSSRICFPYHFIPFHTISYHFIPFLYICMVARVSSFLGDDNRSLLFAGFLQAQRDLIRCFFLHVLQLRSMFPGFLILQSCNHVCTVNTSGHCHRHGHRHGHCHGPQFHSQRGSKRWIWQWRTFADAARCCEMLRDVALH